MGYQFSVAEANLLLDAHNGRIIAGTTNPNAVLEIYSATNTLLVSFNITGFSAAASGSTSLTGTPLQATADSGFGSPTAASYYLIKDRNGVTRARSQVGDVVSPGGETTNKLVLSPSNTIAPSQVVQILSHTLSLPSA